MLEPIELAREHVTLHVHCIDSKIRTELLNLVVHYFLETFKVVAPGRYSLSQLLQMLSIVVYYISCAYSCSPY